MAQALRTTAIANVRIQPAQPKISATNRLLSGLGSERKMEPEKKPFVHETAPLMLIMRLFEEALTMFPILRDIQANSDYGHGWACERLKNIDYTPQDVRAFCLMLEQFSEHKNFPYITSAFLRALVESGKAQEYVLPVKYMPSFTLKCSGTERKRVVIEGNLNNAHTVGKKAEIVVKGRLAWMPDDEMKGGAITAEEGVGACLLSLPCAGTVRVSGRFPAPSPLNPWTSINRASLQPQNPRFLTCKLRLAQYARALKTLAKRFSSTSKIYKGEKLVYSGGLHGIPLYIMHPLLAFQGKLERW